MQGRVLTNLREQLLTLKAENYELMKAARVAEVLDPSVARRLTRIFDTTPLARILFLRHGNTTKAADDSEAADLARVLSEKGLAQCVFARKKWFHKIAPTMGKYAVVSSAQRTEQTLAAILGEVGASSVKFYQGPSIYFEPRSELEMKCWDTYTYAPLRAYWEDPRPAKEIWGNKGQGIVRNIVDVVEAAAEEVPNTLVVTGHSGYQNAAAVLVASMLGKDYSDLLDVNLGEAEGFLVDISSDSVQYMSNA